MIKKDYIEFARKHNFIIDPKMSVQDIKQTLLVNAKNNFSTKNSISDLKIILDIAKTDHKFIKDKIQLVKLLKEIKIDKSFEDIQVNKLNLKNEVNQKPVISVRNLKVSFRDIKKRKKFINVLRGISFDLRQGEIMGFIGESGSGKSVCAKSLFGMNDNAITRADKLEINGFSMIEPKTENSVFTKNSKWRPIRLSSVSYIPQNPMVSLNPTMKIGNQLLEVLDQMDEYKNKKYSEKKLIIIDILEKFGIKNAKQKIKLYPHEFSGGMRQRVVIAIAILSKPKVIIADEPTTALDPTIQASVLSLFKKIANEYNIAIIFVSHDISVISTLCNYVNVFYAGKIVEKAPTYELFTNSQHPYTWALLSSIPESNKGNKVLYNLDGSPPNFDKLPTGDPFSVRNKYAMEIDFREEPPLFTVDESKKHYAATWLLHKDASKVERPKEVIAIAKAVRKDLKHGK